jgi:hypothetical protein
LLLEDGSITRANQSIKPAVFEAIKEREKNSYLSPPLEVGGELRIGEDQAVDGVAIWKEPKNRMGQFTIFLTGLSGETAIPTDEKGEPLKDQEGNPVILRKTLRLDYQVRGDDPAPTEDQLTEVEKSWIMR